MKKTDKYKLILFLFMSLTALEAGIAQETEKGKEQDTDFLKYTEMERMFTARWAKGTKKLMFVHKSLIFYTKKTKELFLERDVADELDMIDR